jgi:hypothetical protein
VQQILNFETLGEVDDGSIRVAVDQALRSIFHDLNDRPGLKRARKLTLDVEFAPRTSDRGELIDVVVGFGIKTTSPARKTAVVMAVKQDGLAFQASVSDNPRQEPLPLGDE